MLGRLRNTFAEINLSALERNFYHLQSMFGGENAFLAPMVKADGYGHGDVQVARVCERAGARFLGVALLEEGIKIRQSGIQLPILTFAPFDSVGAEAIVRYRLTPVLSDFEELRKLKNVLHEDASYPVHIKINTGMQRLGFEPGQTPELARFFENESFLKMEGLCTHFVSSEDFPDESGVTHEQIKIFRGAFDEIKKRVQYPVLTHTHNSAAILSGVKPSFDMARPGISLYGAVPKLHPKTAAGVSQKIAPVLSVKSTIAYIHKVKKGSSVSYGSTWRAPRDSVVAVVPVGYGDGIPRVLGNKASVLIREERCPIVGVICMDYLMADVSQISDLMIGDEVVIIGRQGKGEIRVEELADLAGTISYEILTGISQRLSKIYIH